MKVEFCLIYWLLWLNLLVLYFSQCYTLGECDCFFGITSDNIYYVKLEAVKKDGLKLEKINTFFIAGRGSVKAPIRLNQTSQLIP